MSGALFERLLAASAQVALLVLAVLLVELVLGRRVPARARYGLWLVVVLRLCLPVLPESRLGWVDWGRLTGVPEGLEVARSGDAPPDGTSPEARPGTGARSLAPPPSPSPRPGRARSSGDSGARGSVAGTPGGTTPEPGDPSGRTHRVGPEAPREPVAAVALGAEPDVDEGATAPVGRGDRARPRPASLAGPANPARGAGPAGVAAGADADSPALSWRDGLLAVWLLGIAAGLGTALVRERRFRRRLDRLPPCNHPRLAAALTEVASELRLRRPVRVLELPDLRSPGIHGHLRPRLLVPPGLVDGLSDDELRQVLRHELAHAKRGDLALAAGLLVLRCLWWFHPLVHLALARLHQCQEELRDQDALSTPNAPAPHSYARVLVHLAQRVAEAPHPAAVPARVIPLTRGRRGLRRRIDMILTYRRPSAAARGLGALLVLTVAWFGLVRQGTAAPGPLPAADLDAADGSRSQRQHVAVERQQPLPAWWTELEQALERTVSLDLEDAPLPEAFEAVGAMLGINLVVDREALMDWGQDHEITFAVSDVRGREALDALCGFAEDVEWCLHRESVLVGIREDLPRMKDLRFYRILPVLESFWERGADLDEDDLVSAVIDFADTREGVWDEDGVWYELWSGLLVIQVDESSHAAVQEFLDRLLNLDLVPVRSEEPWRADLEAKLAQPVDVDFDQDSLSDVLAVVSVQSGITVLWGEGHPDDDGVELDLSLKGVRLDTVLSWIAEEAGTSWVLEDGVVKFSARPRLELHLHPIGSLLEVAEDADEVLDGAAEFARSTVDPESWDSDPRFCFVYLGDLALVNQTQENQRRISVLLDTMRRALTD